MTKRQKKVKMAETLVLLALGGLFALSPSASAQSTNQTTMRPTVVAKGQRGAMGPLGMMKQSLSLSDDQVQKLEPVLKEQQEKLNALRRDTSLSRQDRAAKLKDMQKGTDTKIRAHLTSEQSEKWHKTRLNQPQLAQHQAQGAKTSTPFSISAQAERGQQGTPHWQNRVQQPQQPQPAQQGASK